MAKAITVKEELGEIAEAFLNEQNPMQTIGFLFDIQNALIGYGHFESLTEIGRKEFSSNFGVIKNFLQDVQELNKIQ